MIQSRGHTGALLRKGAIYERRKQENHRKQRTGKYTKKYGKQRRNVNGYKELRTPKTLKTQLFEVVNGYKEV